MLKYYSLIVARTFDSILNYTASMKYYKLAYEYCLRSSDHSTLERHKGDYLRVKEQVAKEYSLRFAVGNEVEFYIESGDGETGEWMPGKISELYYRDRSFPLEFTAPYRIELYGEGNTADHPPVYAWVKGDIDRYVRKIGVRSIEKTRYQVRLDAKVAVLAQVYCSKEFVLEVYRILARDRVFVNWLQSEWEIRTTERVVYLYRMLVMYRQPLVRIDSGYHLPSTEEIANDIKNYFTQAALTTPTLYSLNDAEIVILHWPHKASRELVKGSDCARSHYIRFFTYYLEWYKHDRTRMDAALRDCIVLLEHGFSIPPPAACLSPSVLKAFSTSESPQLAGNTQQSGSPEVTILGHLWTALCSFIEKSDTEHAAECPFVYFFVKYCLDYGMGVPKAALAVYDRMNMQLSREFIRCANPSCVLNKLDQSTGQVKFKKCIRCLVVIYCSRACQVAHYPDHKRLCREKGHNSERLCVRVDTPKDNS